MRRRRSALAQELEGGAEPEAPETPAESHEDAAPVAVPPEVWRDLQEAGAAAARRLKDAVASPAFSKLRPADQRALIALALDRAYGPPIKREARLELRGTVSDAVADSLARLSRTDLPETGSRPTRRTTRLSDDEDDPH